MSHEFLSAEESARYLGFKTAGGVRRLVAIGELVPDRRGRRGRYEFTTATLDRWLTCPERMAKLHAELEERRAVRAASKAKATTTPVVYFIECRATGLIKIGKAAFVLERKRSMQTGSAGRLRIRGTVEQSKHAERDLHDLFRKHRAHGEWFRPAPELLEFIKAECTWIPGRR